MSGNQRASRESFNLSVGWYLALIGIGFLVILFRLFQLQVVQGREHTINSLGNILQSVDTIPPRGDILDRTGTPIAKSRNVFALLYFAPNDLIHYYPDNEQRELAEQRGQPWDYLHDGSANADKAGLPLGEIDTLASLLNLDYINLMERLGREALRINGPQLAGFRPVSLIDELTTEQGLLLAEIQLEGMFVEQFAFKREYILGPAAAHVVGYTGFTHDNDPESIRSLGYGPREPVGKDGVERVFETLLHGKPGKRDIEITSARMVNRSGELIAREVPPERGTDLYLTLDAGIQDKAFSILEGQTGATIVVSLVPGHEGKILAMTSSPSFSPERFDEDGYYSSLLVRSDGSPNQSRPLLNRTYRNAFPPGSTFKMVTSTAALQTGAFSAGSSFYCQGYIELGTHNQRFHCHKRAGHGRLTLLEGIAESCDVVFYQVALGLEGQQETIHSFGEYFGYGQPVGVNLPNEAAGILPDAEWKRDHYSSERWNEVDRLWFDGDTATYGIGQSFLTATPLQVMWSAVIVALEGKSPEPRLVKAWEDADGISQSEPGAITELPLDPEVLQTVKSGMRLAVVDGTCRLLNIPGLTTCAKSGTAETGIAGEADHSWVTGFYPEQNPEVGFVVFFQNGGEAYTAVPAARELLLYLKNQFDGSPITGNP